MLFSVATNAQLLPKEGARLNYRLIGCKFPAEKDALNYIIEIAEGTYYNQDSFANNIIRSYGGTDNKIIIEVPNFGDAYSWRVVSNFRSKSKRLSKLFHFTIRTSDLIDTSKLRLKLLTPTIEYRDHFVTLEANRVICDMNGAPVWFLPDTNGISGSVMDLKFTDQGMTFLNSTAYETDYQGNILWKAPSKTVAGNVRFYHHEFLKLPNDCYMVLGMETILCKTVAQKDGAHIIIADGKSEEGGFKLGRFGTILEFDKDGKVVWEWKSSKYLLAADIADYELNFDSARRYDPHDNAFFFDKKNSCIYLGFRNLNRIIKIDYPSGKVIRTYGETFNNRIKSTGNNFFCNQHSIEITHDSLLCVFNNNSCRLIDSIPSVGLYREPRSDTGGLTKVWEFKCPFDKNDFPPGYPVSFSSGGNAKELTDGSFFINMGSEYSRLLIVNREKKILWSALPQRYVETDNKWLPMHQYRSNIISRNKLMQLIWLSENRVEKYN